MLEGVDGEGIVAMILGAGGFIGAAIAGIMKGRQKAASDEPDSGVRLAGGIIMDNTSMLMLTESIKEMTEAVYRLRDDVRENSHQIERLRDKL